MRRFFQMNLVMTLLLTGSALAQTNPTDTTLWQITTTSPSTTIGIVTGWSENPKTPHEYAMQKIEEYQKYMNAHDRILGDLSLSYYFIGEHVGLENSFTVDANGKPVLKGISLEDAFLILWADKLDQILEKDKEFDKRQELIERAPPKKVTYKGEPYSVYNLPDWSNGTVSGDTFCGLKIVRILEDYPDKQGTVMHEMMHVVTGCDQSPALHRLITQIAPGLVRMLQDNPDLVKYLTEKPNFGNH